MFLALDPLYDLGDMTISEIQIILKQQGFDPGPIDGVWGRKTISALKSFQQAKSLQPDGILGPKTLRALKADGPLLVWYEEALHLQGVQETPGSLSNPEIISWAKNLDIRYQGDDIPWCGLFVAHCIGATLTEESLPSNPLGARNWLKFGKSVQPQRGSVLVFWRDSVAGYKGHVGFYHEEDTLAYHVLGGNQNDSVNIRRIPKSRLLDARWPTLASSIHGPVVFSSRSIPSSQKEQ